MLARKPRIHYENEEEQFLVEPGKFSFTIFCVTKWTILRNNVFLCVCVCVCVRACVRVIIRSIDIPYFLQLLVLEMLFSRTLTKALYH